MESKSLLALAFALMRPRSRLTRPISGLGPLRKALASATLPAGDYYVVTMVGSNPSTSQVKIFADGGWVAFNLSEDELAEKGTVVHVEPGKSIELSPSGLV